MATKPRQKRAKPSPQEPAQGVSDAGSVSLPFEAAVIERWPIETLYAHARNARTHSLTQIAQIVTSMREFGWTYPILADRNGEIIAGHGRVLAAKELGLTEVPVIIAPDEWDDVKRRAYMLADNKIALNAGWDEPLLQLEITELLRFGADIAITGFSTDELDALTAAVNATPGGEGEGEPSRAGALAERFGVPPFSVLNAREGWWQDRKRAWLALGIQSELGRGGVDGLAESFANQDKLDAFQKKGRKANAVPGGGTDAAGSRQGGANATPGGSMMPAMNYSKTRSRGDGRGRAV